jgi:hypothetical protein
MRIVATIAALALTLSAGPTFAQQHPAFEAGTRALHEMRYADAEALWETMYRDTEGEAQGQAAFFWAFSAYQQGAVIARENRAVRDPQRTREALQFLAKASERLENASHPDKERMAAAIAEWIAIMESDQAPPRPE